MSNVDGVGAPPPPAPVPNAEGGVAATAGSGGAGSANITITSLEDLKVKARPLYDAMMMALAKHIVDYQNRSNDRIKKTLDESRS